MAVLREKKVRTGGKIRLGSQNGGAYNNSYLRSDDQKNYGLRPNRAKNHMVACLPNKPKALSSSPNTTRKKKKEKLT
jgi:hypothetical protein